MLMPALDYIDEHLGRKPDFSRCWEIKPPPIVIHPNTDPVLTVAMGASPEHSMGLGGEPFNASDNLA